MQKWTPVQRSPQRTLKRRSWQKRRKTGRTHPPMEKRRTRRTETQKWTMRRRTTKLARRKTRRTTEKVTRMTTRTISRAGQNGQLRTTTRTRRMKWKPRSRKPTETTKSVHLTMKLLSFVPPEVRGAKGETWSS